MASSANTQESELASAFERLLRDRDLSHFLPFLLGFTSSSSENQHADDHQEQEQEQDQDQDQDHDQEDDETSSNTHNERIILINPMTQGMVVIDGGAGTFDALFQELGTAKKGHPPASKASIEAMPSVQVSEFKDQESECTICLEGWEEGKVVKEMPCKHRFHGDCIGKWLGIHGSCPVCRFKMPFDKEDQEGRQRRRRSRIGRHVWVSLSSNSSRDRTREREETNQTPSSDSTDNQMEN